MNDAKKQTYLAQRSRKSLSEGLEEFYDNPELLDPRGLSGAAKELMMNHDRAHVVFGCDTSLRNEVLMDTWTIFGTDKGFVNYVKYLRLPEARQLAAEPGLWNIAKTLVYALPDVLDVIRRSRRMKKKWPFESTDKQAGRALADIREEFGIRVMP